MKKIMAVLALTSASLFCVPASAMNFAILGAAGFGSGPATPLIGGELTWGLGPIALGGFYEESLGTVASGYFGAVGRLGLGPIPLFIDGKAGLTSLNSAVIVGAGLGYKISLGPVMELDPRVAFVGSTSSWNAGLLLQIGF